MDAEVEFARRANCPAGAVRLGRPAGVGSAHRPSATWRRRAAGTVYVAQLDCDIKNDNDLQKSRQTTPVLSRYCDTRLSFVYFKWSRFVWSRGRKGTSTSVCRVVRRVFVLYQVCRDTLVALIASARRLISPNSSWPRSRALQAVKVCLRAWIIDNVQNMVTVSESNAQWWSALVYSASFSYQVCTPCCYLFDVSKFGSRDQPCVVRRSSPGVECVSVKLRRR